MITETVQAEAGIIAPSIEWLQALKKRCEKHECLFILDEIQAGFGRTGKLWGFENFDLVPDVLLLGKALGGGMPLGAFIADKKLMDHFTDQPVLGHITTFGGHPVSCAAGKAAFEILMDEQLAGNVNHKTELFKHLLVHPSIKAVRSFGLWMAVEFENYEQCKKAIDRCIENGVLTDWFLFASNCLRISPPLTITEDEIRESCRVILQSL